MTPDASPLLERSRFPIVPYALLSKTGSGHTPSRSNPEYWTDTSIPWVTTGDVSPLRTWEVSVLEDTAHHISGLGLANSAATIHPKGTVFLSRTASVGFAGIMGADMATSQDFFTWTCGPELNPRYLMWVLRAMKSVGEFDRLMYGSTHKTVYVPDLLMLRGPLPNLELQVRIANFLEAQTSRLDALISAQRKAAELAGERFRSLRSELVSGGVPLGAPNWNEAVGERRGWETAPLWMVSLNRDAQRIPLNAEERGEMSGEFPYYGANNVVDYVNDWLFEGAHVLVGEDGAPFFDEERDVAWVAKGRYWVNNHAHVLQATQVSPTWLAECLNVTDYSQYVTGSTRDKLTQEGLNAIPIPIPPSDVQDEIVCRLRDARDVLSSISGATSKEVHLLRERQRSLVATAVTGQLELDEYGDAA